jgi:hypothetical protein
MLGSQYSVNLQLYSAALEQDPLVLPQATSHSLKQE